MFDFKVAENIKDFLFDVDKQGEYFKMIFQNDRWKLPLLIKRLIKLLNAMIEANDDVGLLTF